jgi:hypothetical protein
MDFYVSSDSGNTLVSSDYALSALTGTPYDSANDLAAIESASSDSMITDISVLYPTYTVAGIMEKAIESLSSGGKITDYMDVESISFLLAYSKPMMLSILYCLVNGMITGDELSLIKDGEIRDPRSYLADLIMRNSLPSAYLTLKTPKAGAYPDLDMTALKMGDHSILHSELASNSFFSDSGESLWSNAVATKYVQLRLSDLKTMSDGGSQGTSASSYASGSVSDLMSGDVDFERKRSFCVPYTLGAKANSSARDLILNVMPALDVSDIGGVMNAAENAEYLAGFEKGTDALAESDIDYIKSNIKPVVSVTGKFKGKDITVSYVGMGVGPTGSTVTYCHCVNLYDRENNGACPESISIRANGATMVFDQIEIFAFLYGSNIRFTYICKSSLGAYKSYQIYPESETLNSDNLHYDCILKCPGTQDKFEFKVFNPGSDESKRLTLVLSAAAVKKYCSDCDYDYANSHYGFNASIYEYLYSSGADISKGEGYDAVAASGINYVALLNRAIKITGRSDPQEYSGKFLASSYSSAQASSLSDTSIIRESSDGIKPSMSYLGDLCGDIIDSAQSAFANPSSPRKIPALESTNSPYAIYFEALPGNSVTTDFSGITVNYADEGSYDRFFSEAIGILGSKDGYSDLKGNVSLLNRKDYLTALRTSAFNDLYLKYEKSNSTISEKVELLKFFIIQLGIIKRYFDSDSDDITKALRSPIVLETVALIHMSERFFSLKYGYWYQEIMRPMMEPAWLSAYDLQRKERSDSDAEAKLLIKKCVFYQFAACSTCGPISSISKAKAVTSATSEMQKLCDQGEVSIIKTLLSANGGSIVSMTKDIYGAIAAYLSSIGIPTPERFTSSVNGMFGSIRGMLKEEGLL